MRTTKSRVTLYQYWAIVVNLPRPLTSSKLLSTGKNFLIFKIVGRHVPEVANVQMNEIFFFKVNFINKYCFKTNKDKHFNFFKCCIIFQTIDGPWLRNSRAGLKVYIFSC